MGQALLPEHFYAQEQSLREEFHLRLRSQLAPYWGVALLKWDEFELLKGIISIQELTLVLPSGTLIDVPGNTGPAFLNLNATGATAASVFVHLASSFEVVDVGAGDGAESIERIVQKIQLSTNAYAEGSAQSFHLADFQCGPDNTWSMSPNYLPPHLLVGRSPFFEPYLARMDAILRATRQALTTEVQDNYLAVEGSTSARASLGPLFRLQALLGDLRAGVHQHPYVLFEALRGLYIDLCVHRGVSPTVIEKPYAHDELAGCFAGLLDWLEEQAQINKQTIPYVEFVRETGMLVCQLGKDIRRARDVYLLLQKPQVAMTVDVSRVKLASESRIGVVYERALRGIPYTKVDNVPFKHGLASTVEFYQVSPGQEWDHAVRDGRVVLYDAPVLAGCRLYLYCRSE
jgi:type VI secretion system protein ImpJ